MTLHAVEPKLGADTFSCPHCDTAAHQDWYSLFLKPENDADVVVVAPEAITTASMALHSKPDEIKEIDQFVERLKKNELTFEYQKHSQSLKVKMANLHLSSCHSCNGFAIWVGQRLVFPYWVEKIPEIAEQDLDEAAAVLNKSPAGAAALMRICIQKLMPLLKENGKRLDENISSLVRKGLEVEIQQAMEVLQVLRDEPVQLTNLESKEEQETALRFFDSLKAVLERRMLGTRARTVAVNRPE
ncbi:MAG TPA: DUF4145 domain-containing protein [Xanthobacteraceae bacterium]|jgi:hypothetical protein